MLGVALTVPLLCVVCPRLAPARTLLAENAGRPSAHHHVQHQIPHRAKQKRHHIGHRRRPVRGPRRIAASRPVRHLWTVRIPSIGLNATVIVLGSPASVNLPVPPLSAASQVGWYNFSSVPGQPGNAVLAGHVDTYLGPAVFYNLYLLRPGKPIYIRLGTHGYTRYSVTSIRELPKADFPADQIFGTTNARRLWLITCGGSFDYGTHRYLDNIVVSASQ